MNKKAWKTENFGTLYIEHNEEEAMYDVYSSHDGETAMASFVALEYAHNFVLFVVEADRLGYNVLNLVDTCIYTIEELDADVKALRANCYTTFTADLEEE